VAVAIVGFLVLALAGARKLTRRKRLPSGAMRRA
jgi:hypothetical protein